MKDIMRDELGAPKIVGRSTFHAELDALRVREKAHTREGDAIAAARRGLPMVEVDGATPLIGELSAVTLLDAFEGRRMLIAYYFMWHAGKPTAEQCEGCTWVTSQVRELSEGLKDPVLFPCDVLPPLVMPVSVRISYRDAADWAGDHRQIKAPRL